MKLAIVGSRGLRLSNEEIGRFVGDEVTEIVSGGAIGIDRCAASFARERGLALTEFLPDYDSYGKRAPLIRNDRIAEYADAVIAFWDGSSRGTDYTVERFRRHGKPARLIKVSYK